MPRALGTPPRPPSPRIEEMSERIRSEPPEMSDLDHPTGPEIPRLNLSPAATTRGGGGGGWTTAHGSRGSPRDTSSPSASTPPSARSARTDASSVFGSPTGENGSARATFEVEPSVPKGGFLTLEKPTAKLSSAPTDPAVCGWSLDTGGSDSYGTTVDERWVPKTSRGLKLRCCQKEVDLLSCWRWGVLCCMLTVAFVLGVVIADVAMGGTTVFGARSDDASTAAAAGDAPAGAAPTTPPPPRAAAPVVPPAPPPRYGDSNSGYPMPPAEIAQMAVHVCPQLYLGPDIGFQNVMEFHNEDGSCHVSMEELGKVCESFYAECLSL